MSSKIRADARKRLDDPDSRIRSRVIASPLRRATWRNLGNLNVCPRQGRGAADRVSPGLGTRW